jgi:hypothetical protein
VGEAAAADARTGEEVMQTRIPDGVKDALAFLALARSEAQDALNLIDGLVSDLIAVDDDIDRDEDIQIALESSGNLSRHLEEVQKIFTGLDSEATVEEVEEGDRLEVVVG